MDQGAAIWRNSSREPVAIHSAKPLRFAVRPACWRDSWTTHFGSIGLCRSKECHVDHPPVVDQGRTDDLRRGESDVAAEAD